MIGPPRRALTQLVYTLEFGYQEWKFMAIGGETDQAKLICIDGNDVSDIYVFFSRLESVTDESKLAYLAGVLANGSPRNPNFE